MYCGTATFSVPLLFKGPELYFFARATFSKEAVFQNSSFSTSNLVEFSDLKVPGGFTEWCTTQKIFSLNTMTKTFATKWPSQGSMEQDNLSKNANNFRFWGI